MVMQFMEIWDELPLRSGTIRLKSGGLINAPPQLIDNHAELAPTLRGTGEHASFDGASEYVSITKCGYRIPFILRALIHMT